MNVSKHKLKINTLLSPRLAENKGLRSIFSPGIEQEKAIEQLHEKLKFLEIENNELRNEIAFNSGDREKIEYYLRLRRSLVEEIEKLKRERVGEELNFNTELEKVRQENVYLTECLEKERVEKAIMMCSKSNEEDLFSTQITKSPPKKGKLKFFQNEYDATSNFSEDIKEPIAMISTGNDYSKTKSPVKEGLYNQLFLSSQNLNFLEEVNAINSNSNSYLPIINELEERIRTFETIIYQKDKQIDELREVKKEDLNKINKQLEDLKREGEIWKAKYTAVLGTNKTMGQEYTDNNEKTLQSYKVSMGKTIFDFESKILHLEKLCNKYEEDIKALLRMNNEIEIKKHEENENLKTNLSIVNENYRNLNNGYDDNLKMLNTQLETLKKLYISRENDFVQVTNYYNETIKTYARPLHEINNKEHINSIHKTFADQVKENESLKLSLEHSIKEHTKLQNEYINSKPKMRQRVEEVMEQCEKIVKQLSANHNSIEAKLDYLYNFMNFFDEKFVFFNTLIEDKRKMEQKYDLIDCQLKMIDLDGKNEEIAKLKEHVFKMTRDIELKNGLIRDYEELIDKISLNQTNSKIKPKLVPEEIVLKLKAEVAMLANQILQLSQTKEGIEKFYQVELGNLMLIVRQKNEKIDELSNIIRKMENDISGKKETIFNLWMLEFKEFKDKLLTMTDIKSIIERFKIEGEELNIFKETLNDEELILLREEIKIKDQIYKESQKNHENEKAKLTDMLEGYRKTIKTKIETFDKVVSMKEGLIDSIKYHMDSLSKIDTNKRNVSISLS
jgi:hypothetical protein